MTATAGGIPQLCRKALRATSSQRQARSTLTYKHMVARFPLNDLQLDRLFRAVASRYDMSFAAVQKHVAVLGDAAS